MAWSPVHADSCVSPLVPVTGAAAVSVNNHRVPHVRKEVSLLTGGGGSVVCLTCFTHSSAFSPSSKGSRSRLLAFTCGSTCLVFCPSEWLGLAALLTEAQASSSVAHFLKFGCRKPVPLRSAFISRPEDPGLAAPSSRHRTWQGCGSSRLCSSQWPKNHSVPYSRSRSSLTPGRRRTPQLPAEELSRHRAPQLGF